MCLSIIFRKDKHREKTCFDISEKETITYVIYPDLNNFFNKTTFLMFSKRKIELPK